MNSLHLEPLITSIYEKLLERNQTLCLAESCTGGLISSELTRKNNISCVFKGCLVCYSQESKIHFLEVPEELLSQFSVVSKEVSLFLAQKAREKFKSDWSCSTTGWAGPTGGDEHHPVGTVIFGFAGPHLATTKTVYLEKLSRTDIQIEATKIVFKQLNHFLTKE